MMDILNSIPWWILFITGFVIGAIGMRLYLANESHGAIHVTHGEDSDKYLFEFNIPPENIPKMKKVVFRVVIVDDASQNLQSI